MIEAAPRDRRSAPGQTSATSVSAKAEETFEASLIREILRSERLRLSIIAVLLGVSFIRWIIVGLFFPLTLPEQAGAPIDYRALTVLWGIAFAYELVAILMVTRALAYCSPGPDLSMYIFTLLEEYAMLTRYWVDPPVPWPGTKYHLVRGS